MFSIEAGTKESSKLPTALWTMFCSPSHYAFAYVYMIA